MLLLYQLQDLRIWKNWRIVALVKVVVFIGHNRLQIMTSMRYKGIRPGPSEISYKNMKFLIMDRPTDDSMPCFVEELNKHKVRDVVRVCEPTYKSDQLTEAGIKIVDLEFEDGTSPPNNIIEEWFNILKNRFQEDPESCVAVHCVAGLGRAPVLVALALIELGMKYEDAVELIRQKRRGAVNAKQLAFLEKYRPKSRLKLKNGHSKHNCILQ